MDPITATTTLITLATFTTDLIKLGQDLMASIEKVSDNRRRLRDLTNEVLRTLADLANLTRGHDGTFGTPALLTALGNVKGHMLHIREECQRISSSECGPTFRRARNRIKLWWNRDEIEAEIRRLKERVNDCYIQFMVFSVSRTEFTSVRIERTAGRIEDIALQAVNTSLRVEQTLITNTLENQPRLQRLQGMMTGFLLDTTFGRNVMNQTTETISSDPKHQTLESQYLAVNARYLVESVQRRLASSTLAVNTPVWELAASIRPVFLKSGPPQHVLLRVLHLVVATEGDPATAPLESLVSLDLAVQLAELGFNSEATAWQLATVQMLQRLARAPGDHCASVIPWLADALQKLSEQYGRQEKFELALQASRQSLDLHQFSSETSSEVDNRTSYVSALVLHSRNLRSTQQPLAAISIAKEAVQRCRPMLPEIMMQMSGPGALSPDEMEYKVTMYLSSFLALAQAFASVGRLRGAAKAAAEALDSLPKTLQIFSHPQSTAHRTLEIFARGP
ncbi:hypothetical protein B0H13DRAFT_1986677, partial [Mycena leptocephala]